VHDVLRGSGATALKLTPAHLSVFVNAGVASQTLRTLIVGGDVLHTSLARDAHRAFGARIFNEYGPTEATVGCVVHRFDVVRDTAPTVPIGVPAPGVVARVVDEHMALCAEGEMGHLCIAGPGVARGYLEDHEATRARFRTLDDGTRAYLTGDRARVDDGVLTMGGRIDEQLKVNGQRVEPREIEACMLEHPGVRAAVVRLVDARLHGWFVGSRSVVGAALREHLQALLPPSWVPAVLTPLDALPLTYNGKLDTAALPVPPRIFEAMRGMPRDHEEVARAWARVLSLDRSSISPRASFYDLGGDSLTTLRMLNAVASLAGPARAEVFLHEVRAVLREPTLERVCHALERAKRHEVT
jgi:acyl-coenzyme A synthetase/AMP-(fatty) acid ligase